jgi:twitching motility protein PilI
VRLQQARTETRVQSWLAVECAGLGLLMPLATAGEIFPLSVLLPIPHTRPWFMGVANLRGRLHGVVDLAAFLGLRAPLAIDSVREQAQLLAFNPVQGAHCAVLVDRLAGLRSAGQLVAEPGDAQPRPAFASARWRDAEGRIWQEIDLAALARNEDFLAIAA